MSPRSRILCLVLLSLLLNNGHIASVPVGPALTECCPYQGPPPQQVNSLLTTQGLYTAFPTQRFNEVFSFGALPPALAINTVATTNYGAPNPNSFTAYPAYSPVESPSPLPIVETITETLPYPQTLESVTIVDNYPPVTQTIQVQPPTATVAETYQTPITVQIPLPPPETPFVASPLPDTLPSQNIVKEIYTQAVVPETKIIESATVTSLPVENTSWNNYNPSCVPGCGSQSLPVTLQINLGTPSWNPEPAYPVMPQPAPAPSPYSSFNPSFEMPLAPPPIIVMEKSKSSLKNILPILMLTLFDGGCGNNGGGGGCSCSQSSASIPIPFPIIVPTYNPVVYRGCNRCRQATVEES